MNKLFFKIFIWFWLAMALVWSVFLISNQWNRNEQIGVQFRDLHDQRLVLAGWTALRIARDRPGALAQFIAGMEEDGTPYPWVLDADFQDIAGREVDREALDLARAAHSDAEDRIHVGGQTGTYQAHRLRSRGGTEYVVVQRIPSRLDFPPPSPLPVAGRWLGVVLIAGLVCYGLARYLAAPVDKLSLATRRFTTGDLDVRVSPELTGASEEVVALGHDFDRMAERIGALLTTQRQLLSDISHELRSPLARLSVALGLARRHSDAGNGTQAALDRIEREAERLNDLIGELLALTRLEGGDRSVGRQPVRLDELLRGVVSDAHFEAGGRGCAVSLTAVTAARTVGFEELLRRALENVVRNAVRYTQEGSTVEVFLEVVRDDGRPEALIRVRDHGPGVPEEAVERLFEPFYRTAEARDRESGGAGLGLAISQRAIRLHGGDIAAHNLVGGGLEVEIRLPATPLDSASSSAAIEQAQISAS